MERVRNCTAPPEQRATTPPTTTKIHPQAATTSPKCGHVQHTAVVVVHMKSYAMCVCVCVAAHHSGLRLKLFFRSTSAAVRNIYEFGNFPLLLHICLPTACHWENKNNNNIFQTKKKAEKVRVKITDCII